MSRFQEAVGKAAIDAQDHARENLESMVYSQPPAASGYIRTRTLMRGMHAHKASTTDSGKHAKAASGTDLKATDPLSVVERRGKEFRTAVSNPVKYADKVHDGVNQPQERPFTDGVQEEWDNAIEDHISDAWLTAGNRIK